MAENRILQLINDFRRKSGLRPLTRSPALDKEAVWMTQDMDKNNYFHENHIDSQKRNAEQRIRDFGVTDGWTGENLYATQSPVISPEEAVQAWINSPDHRDNLLNPHYTQTGIGITSSNTSKFKNYYANSFYGPSFCLIL